MRPNFSKNALNKCFGCPRYNFSCPDIIQTAEIPQNRHMLLFANEELNCTGKKNGDSHFFVPINFVSRIVRCKAVKQETAAFVTDASPNRKQFPRDKSAAQWNWILAIILHS